MDTLRFELGLRVPEDVSIIGYDDVALAAWGSYQLTTIRQPTDQMIAATVDLLMAQVGDAETDPQKIEIAGPLIVRHSARIVPDWGRV